MRCEQRPGGWVDGIGWVALLHDVIGLNAWTADDADEAKGSPEGWVSYGPATVDYNRPVIVMQWADGTVPAPPDDGRPDTAKLRKVGSGFDMFGIPLLTASERQARDAAADWIDTVSARWTGVQAMADSAIRHEREAKRLAALLDARAADAHRVQPQPDELRAPTQADVLAWVAERWPDRTTPLWRAAKLCEEAGEVMGAVIKMDEGRKTLADLRQETAQVAICAMALAESAGFDLADAVANEYVLAASSATEAPPDAPDTGPRWCAINSTSMCAAYGCFEIGRCGRRPARSSGGTA